MVGGRARVGRWRVSVGDRLQMVVSVAVVVRSVARRRSRFRLLLFLLSLLDDGW